ncbi:putative Ig domain-containing protein [bacterium]|nr:putative Ig domain-containing protein [bacterium]
MNEREKIFGLVNMMIRTAMIFLLGLFAIDKAIGQEYPTGYEDGDFQATDPYYICPPSSEKTEIPGASDISFEVSSTSTLSKIEFFKEDDTLLISRTGGNTSDYAVRLFCNGPHWVIVVFIETITIETYYTVYGVDLKNFSYEIILPETSLYESLGDVQQSPDDKLAWFYLTRDFTGAEGSYHWIYDFSLGFRILTDFHNTHSDNLLSAEVVPISGKPNVELMWNDDDFVTRNLPWLEVTEPGSGDRWISFSEYNIEWDKQGWPSGSEVSLYYTTSYSTLENSVWYSISTVTNSGSYKWTVPFLAPESDECRILVADAGDHPGYVYVYDVMDEDFTLSPPALTVTDPDGGENWEIGSGHPIQWSDTDLNNSDRVTIELSRDNGSSYSPLFSNIYNNHSKSWEVSGPPTSQALIKIKWEDHPEIFDISDNNFSIHAPSLMITSASLPDGMAGAGYSVTLQAEGGWGTYAWSVLSGSLPPGLNINSSTGKISGIPTTEGNYNFTVKAEDSQSPPDSDTQAFTVTINAPQPVLEVNKTSLTFNAVEEGANPEDQIFNITNGGGGAFNWSITDDMSWLSVDPVSGSQASGSSAVTVSVNASGFDTGAYYGTITVNAAGAMGSPKTIDVTLNVTEPQPPVLQVNRTSLTFSAAQDGANPADQIFNITNGGNGTFDWSITEDASWLSVNPSNGSTTAETDTITVSADISGLTEGSYFGTITVTSPGVEGGPQTIDVGLNITNIPVIPGDENWDDRFSYAIPGIDGTVNAIAVSGNDIYVGGWITQASNTAANNIAKWDGHSWSALGTGLNSHVDAIAVNGTDIYVVGNFTQAGGIEASHIAKWDGHQWSALGGGIVFDGGYTQYAGAVAVDGNNVYAGGNFTRAGSIEVNHIAKWDGTAWSALGSGVGGGVYTIAYAEGIVYVGGSLYQAGGVEVNHIARWDGNAWSAMGEGLDDDVNAIVIDGSDVYAGGDFSNSVAKWDGSTWNSVGDGVGGVVYTIAVSGSDIYAGKWFWFPDEAGEGIVKWDGTNWTPLGSGVNDWVYAVAVSGGDVYAGGSFTKIGGIEAMHIAKWDGTQWSVLKDSDNGKGADNWVNAVASNGSAVYAGGRFTQVGGIEANYIAKWDGTEWSPLGSGVSNYVYDIAVSGSDVYAGGRFGSAGGQAVSCIAKWDGTTWSSLGGGVNEWVFAVAASGSDVYAGGRFTQAGGVDANCIAKWDGSQWSSLGSGTGRFGYVHDIVVDGNDVYVGGWFTRAGGVEVNYIAKWDGTQWSALGNGMGDYVDAVAVYRGDVYVGGNFWDDGTYRKKYIARWDGSAWSIPGNGLDDDVCSFAVIGDNLYVGGDFMYAGDVKVNNIAKWDGSAWSPLGSGLWGSDSEYYHELIRDIAAHGSDLYVSGDFTQAGGKASCNIACWHASDGHVTSLPSGRHQADGAKIPDVFALKQNYPNPFNPVTTIAFDLPEPCRVQIEIYNMRGKRCVTLLDREYSAGSHQAVWDGRNESGRMVTSGIYLYRIRAGAFQGLKKLILVR